MASRALALAVLLLGAGCAHVPAQTALAPDWGIARASTVDTFEIGGQADHWGVRVTDDEMYAVQPDFALARIGGEIRGRANGVPVAVGFQADEGGGVYRGAPFQVKVERTTTGLQVNGLLGGSISNFEVTADRINGRIGTCGWDVRWNGTVYSGSRACGSRIEPISVSLPATMAGWPDVEVAGALGILMNVGAPMGLDRLANNSAEFRRAPRLSSDIQSSMLPGPAPAAPSAARATGARGTGGGKH
ncbi:MAG TPA: hypothetical protein VGG91_06025 [Myxococcaceae bacterium]